MKRTTNHFTKHLAVLTLITAAALTGCSSAPTQTLTEDVIVLQEPEVVTNSTDVEPVVRRNLYNATLYPTTISPYIEEYSFETDQQFGSYGPLLGDRVRKGDILMTASGNALSSQIAALQETLQDMAADHMEYCAEAEENLQELRGKLSQLQGILDNLDRAEPAETVSGNNGKPSADSQPNPEYASWKEERRSWQAEYNLTDYYITTGERQLQKQQELYDLDCSYYNELLQELLSSRSQEIIRSQISGVVVALGDYVYDSRLSKGQPVIAVADLNRKYLRCSSIRGRLLTNAAQIYAFINGNRYDVTLDQSGSSESYTQTTFLLQDEDDEVPVGSYAVLVLLSDYREQVLTVRTDAIFREDSKDFVYVLENGESIPKEIKKGLSDSLYTEILSGLNEGESVLVPKSASLGASSATLEKGTISNTHRLGGQIVYPLKTIVRNPVTNGTVYLNKYAVKQNDYVTAGSTLALIDVEADPTALARREVSLQRQKERLEDLISLDREEDEKTILLTQESIQKEEEQLAKIKEDYAATEILSPAAGYVVYLRPRSSGEVIPQTDSVIAHIADQSIAYLAVSAANGQSAGYGTMLTITCTDMDGEEFTVERQVLTVDSSLLSDSLAGDAMAIMPLEARLNMTFSEKKPIPVQFTGEKMENVILVPKDAVTSIGSNTYVNIQNDDGSVTTVSFLSGGSDKEYYWAIDGLAEGMKICWE